MDCLRHILSTALVGVIAAALSSCTGSAGTTGREVDHQSKQSAIVPTYTLSQTIGESQPDRISTAVRMLRSLERGATIGGAGSSAATWIDRVGGVAVTDEDGIIVLDARLNTIRKFSEKGALLSTIARPGRSSEGLALPLRLSVSGRNAVIFDATGEIKTFSLDTGSLVARQRSPVPIEDGCASDLTFVRSWSRSATVHQILGDAIAVAFAAPDDGPPTVSRELSRGKLECVGDAVFVAHNDSAMVIAYRVDGTRLWATGIEDFIRATLIEAADGTIRRSETTHDVVASLFAINGDTLVLQTERWQGDGMSDRRTYVLDASTGRGVVTGKHLPRMMAASPRIAVAVESEFPSSLTVYTASAISKGKS